MERIEDNLLQSNGRKAGSRRSRSMSRTICLMMALRRRGATVLRHGVRQMLVALLLFAPTLCSKAMEWRGLMIDVSRHYMPIDFLEREIDAMHRYGLNTLHLHLTDAAGWRMEIRKYPRLTEIGAWRTAWEWKTWWNDGHRAYADSSAYGGYYTQEELRSLVDYAAKRGVTIVPEIEFPAHSEEVIAAYPHLGYNKAELDMASDDVFRFMDDVLTEVAAVFPSPYLHVGGDEAGTQHARQPDAMRRINAIVRRLGRRLIVWDEALTDDPADSTMAIMVWRNTDTAIRAMRLGHQVVMSPGAFCYLDKYQDAPATQPEAMGGYLPLKDMYQSLMASSEALRDEPKLLGYQANLWTEYIPTAAHAEYMAWPRALCIAALPGGCLCSADEGPTDASYLAFRRRAIEATRYLRDTLHINTFPLDKEVGQRPEYDQPTKSLSTGRGVTYLSRYYDGYAAGGCQALTDGLRGGWSNTDGRWQGFIGRGRMDVVIDLQKVRRIRSVRSSFMQNTGPEIYLPARIIISSSRDGRHYTTLSDTTYVETQAPVDFVTRGWTGRGRARYIRFQALNGSRGGWVFADEVEVY